MRASTLLGAGAGGLALSIWALSRGPGWFGAFFYLPAWGFCLIFLDGLNRLLRGRSPLRGAEGGPLLMAFLSTPWWLFFEALNFRIKNWSYEGLPAERPLRWIGYALAFATVLPAVFECAALFDVKGGKRKERKESEGVGVRLLFFFLPFFPFPSVSSFWASPPSSFPFSGPGISFRSFGGRFS